ncbi:MAG: PilN domain-containing protein [Syntrophales bacterium]|jgi:Tfp pilus assembly protein PilN|nr:PilN domain-containing protein [Syntrophales bacterium]
MTAQALYDKIKAASLPGMGAVIRGCRALHRLLTFSIADEIVSPRRDIVVCIHDGGMSMAYGSRFLSRIKIGQYRECALAEGKHPSPDVLAAGVASFVGECRAIRTPITLSIPKAWAVIRAVDLPAAANENLAGVVSCELDRFTPLTPANAYFDFRLLNERNGWLSVTVAAARCDLIKPYIDALGAKGLPVDRVTLHPSATANLLHFVSDCSNVIYLVVNGDDYELGHVIESSVSRAVNGRFETEDEDARIGKIVFEMTSLVEKIRKCGALPGQCMVPVNSIDREKLAARAPRPIRTVSDREIARRFPSGLKGISHTALGCLLECLRPKATAMNLLSKGRHHAAKTPVLITSALLLALTVLGIACAVAPLHLERARLQEIERQIVLRKDEIRKIESLQKDIDALDGEINSIVNLRKKNPGALRVIKELTTILPKTSWLSRIRISAATVDIEGLATTSPAEFLPGIEASTLFGKVEFAAPTVRDSAMKADRFVMKMELRGAGQEEGKRGSE